MEPSPSRDFALGAMQFLITIERALQTRHAYNLSADDLDFPVLRLGIAPNPDPLPIDPGVVAAIFTDIGQGMAIARATLEAIPSAAEVLVSIDLAGLWFDVDGDGEWSRREGVLDVISGSVMRRSMAGAEGNRRIAVRFDGADVAWLLAYTHLLSGISDVVLAWDPTEVIAQVLGSAASIREIRGSDDDPFLVFSADDAKWIDMFAMLYGSVNRMPEQSHLADARNHFLAMIAANREFWLRVDRETDNKGEWIPNDRQTAALPYTLPQGTGAAWLEVLSDAEAVLNGELLIPHWRLARMGGVNLKTFVDNPAPVDIVTWIQGSGLLPYMEAGETINSNNMRQFERMISGDAITFMLLLN